MSCSWSTTPEFLDFLDQDSDHGAAINEPKAWQSGHLPSFVVLAYWQTEQIYIEKNQIRQKNYIPN